MSRPSSREGDLAWSRLKYEAAAYRVRLAILDLEEALDPPERKFNPNHDPANGRFTSGGGGFGGAGSSGGWRDLPPNAAGHHQSGGGILVPGSSSVPVRPTTFQPSSGGQTPASPNRPPSGGHLIMNPESHAKTEAIKAEFERLTGHKLRVTSGYRDARGQAAAMYKKLQVGGSFRRYKNAAAAAEILAAYTGAKAAGAGPASIIASMTSVIKNQIARGVKISDHLTDKAIDISMFDSNGNALNTGQLGVLYSIIHQFGGRTLKEDDPPHIHVKL